MTTGFTCKECQADFEVDWNFDDVTCPGCLTRFRTDYDESDDGICGPWLAEEVIDNEGEA
jgi:hypothetical protein